jgi:hypothetical protein
MVAPVVAVNVAFPAVPPVTIKVWLDMLAGTITFPLAGTGNTAELLLDRPTVTPPAGAAPLSVTVPVTVCPEVTLAGLKVIAVTTGGGFTVSAAVRKSELGSVAVIVEFITAATASVLTLKVPMVVPAAMLKLAGTVAALVLLLIRVTLKPAGGAGPLRFTVPTATEPGPPVRAPGLNMKDVM